MKVDESAAEQLRLLAGMPQGESLWQARKFIVHMIEHFAKLQERKYKATAERFAAMFAQGDFRDLCPNLIKVLEIANPSGTATAVIFRNWRREVDVPEAKTIGFKEWLTTREITALARDGCLPGIPTSLSAVERYMSNASSSFPGMSRPGKARLH